MKSSGLLTGDPCLFMNTCFTGLYCFTLLVHFIAEVILIIYILIVIDLKDN